ncbi:hypothetical protein EDC94DRAFT_581621 [Helicostylum pulchrum]|nr:hypothetical protein EDC94DRAFT_581621 [Helicostylum pulchrum]
MPFANKVGGIKDWAWTLEIQQHGSPHIHMVLWTGRNTAEFLTQNMIRNYMNLFANTRIMFVDHIVDLLPGIAVLVFPKKVTLAKSAMDIQINYSDGILFYLAKYLSKVDSEIPLHHHMQTQYARVRARTVGSVEVAKCKKAEYVE